MKLRVRALADIMRLVMAGNTSHIREMVQHMCMIRNLVKDLTIIAPKQRLDNVMKSAAEAMCHRRQTRETSKRQIRAGLRGGTPNMLKQSMRWGAAMVNHAGNPRWHPKQSQTRCLETVT